MLNPGTKTSSPGRINATGVRAGNGGHQAGLAWRSWAAWHCMCQGPHCCHWCAGERAVGLPWRPGKARVSRGHLGELFLHKLCYALLLMYVRQTPAAASLGRAAGSSAGLQPLRQVLGGTGSYLLFQFCTDAQVFPGSMGSPLAQPATQRPHSNDKGRIDWPVMAAPAGRYHCLREPPDPSDPFLLSGLLCLLSLSFSPGALHHCQSPKLWLTLPTPVPPSALLTQDSPPGRLPVRPGHLGGPLPH